MKRPLLAFLTGIALTVSARAQDVPPPAPGSTDARAVLAAAHAAMSKIGAASYRADLELLPGPDEPMKITRDAVIELGRPDDSARGPFRRPFRIEGEWAADEANAEEPLPFLVAFDGKLARYPLHNRKLLIEEEFKGRNFAMLEAYMLLLPGWMDLSPLQPSDGVEVISEGREEVEGVPCERVLSRRKLPSPPAGMANDGTERVVEQRLWIGLEDHLPRRSELKLVELDAGAESVQFRVETRARALNTEVVIGPERYAVVTPEGYRVERSDGSGSAARLAVGEPAPEWTLADGSGEKHSLAGFRGKVLVLDFWATWCGPCKRAMPALQRLHERYKDKAVRVIGLSANERGGDPVAYKRDNGFTYLGLVKAEAVSRAYGVSGIPHLFVIAADGTVAHQMVGYSEDLEEQLARVIDRLLGEG